MLTTLLRSKLTPSITGHVQGEGPDMLLIHGVGMNADYWGNIAGDLAGQFRLTLIDLPGHGNSQPLKIDKPSLHNFTDTLHTAINDATIVVGHSMGALIALDLAVRYPASVNGIAALNGIYRRDEAARAAVSARVNQLNEHKLADPASTLERWFGSSPQGVNAKAKKHCEDWLNQINPKHYKAAYHAFAHADAPDDSALSNIECRALFMTGSLEPNSTPAMSLAMSQLIERASCHIVGDARHMMSLTHGQQVITALTNVFGVTPHA